MPPKNRNRTQASRSQDAQPIVVPIEEYLTSRNEGDPVPEIMKKLQLSYKNNRQSLNRSLLCMIMRICGLSELMGKLDGANIGEQLAETVEAHLQNRPNLTTSTTLITSPKDKFYSDFMERLRFFFKMLLSEDFQFLKENSNTGFLKDMREWLTTLARVKRRSIRYSAVELAKVLIECQTAQHGFFMNDKKSKKADELANDMDGYFRNMVTDRLRDIDAGIRDSLHNLIKTIFLALETDIADQSLLNDLLLPLLADNNPKIVEGALQTLLNLTKSKKLGKLLVVLAKRVLSQFQDISLHANRNGVLSVKVLLEISKHQETPTLLTPSHISRLFEYYCQQNFAVGLQTSVEVFYYSLYPSEELLIRNRRLVVIEIMNLINNFPKLSSQQQILQQFISYPKLGCELLINMEQMFVVLLQGTYTHNGEDISLGEKDMGSWMLIIHDFARYVKANVERYQAIESQKYDRLRKKWMEIGEEFNQNLLTNIKTIFYERMQGRLAKPYLKLMSQLQLPIAGTFQASADFLVERIVVLFEVETESAILKDIVTIFFNLKSHDVRRLTAHIPSNTDEQNEVFLMKKLALLGKFDIAEFSTRDTVLSIIHEYRHMEDEGKLQLFVGCFAIHQWQIQHLIDSPTEEAQMQYSIIQREIVQFLFEILKSSQNNTIKSGAMSILCRIFRIVCHDSLVDSEAYFDMTEEHVITIYRYLSNEIGLPSFEADHSLSQTKEYSRYGMNLQNGEKDGIIRIIFEILANSLKLATNPNSLELIAGALLAEDDISDNLDATVSKQNLSISVETKSLIQSVYAREKLGTRCLQRFIDNETQQQNANKFVFWRVVQCMLAQFKNNRATREKLLAKMMGVFLKKKMSQDDQKISLNKTLLFVLAEIDVQLQVPVQEGISDTLLIIKKIARRINRQALYRVYMFAKSKNGASQNHDNVRNLFNFLEKATKPGKDADKDEPQAEIKEGEEDNKSQKQNDEVRVQDSDSQEEIHEIKASNVPSRETRSMSKKQH